MALEAGVPVIPVAMINTFDIQPPGQVMPRIMRVGIRIGEPLDFSRYEGMSGDRFVLRSITDEIMYELMQLSGQEYVAEYATKRAEDVPTETAKIPTVNGDSGSRRSSADVLNPTRAAPAPQ